MIVEETLRDMQQLGACDAEIGKRRVEGAEVVLGRLVGPDVLGGDDCREVAAQLEIAGWRIRRGARWTR